MPPVGPPDNPSPAHENIAPAAPSAPAAGPGYWRSLNQLADTLEFRRWLEAEFPTAGTPFLDDSPEAGGLSRRRWLELMGASLALAAVAGCRWKKTELRPFARRPDGRVPGEPEHFATAMDLGGTALGLMVTCVDGRPIKVEGNPTHPASLGGSDAWAQAAILGLYDPDRSQQVVQREAGQQVGHDDWKAFEKAAAAHFAELGNGGGEGFCVLAEMCSSPTLAAMRGRLAESFPNARWYEYEPAPCHATLGGWRADLALDKAEVIACLDADLFGWHPAAVRCARDFAQGREVRGGKMNRLYVVEPSPTVTGASADHRLALPAGRIAAFADRLRAEVERLASGDSSAEAAAATAGKEQADEQSAVADRFVRALAADLAAHRGRCVVAVGPGQPPAVQAQVAAVNRALGNQGQTVSYVADRMADDTTEIGSLGSLVAEMQAGRVGTLLILGGNPVYNAPADFDFAAALAKVGTSIHLSPYRDETSRQCAWHLPQAHFLESWGDALSYDGTYSVVQPMIEPLCGGRSAIEVLGLVLGVSGMNAGETVRARFLKLVSGSGAAGADAEKLWKKTVQDGLLADRKLLDQRPDAPQPNPADAQQAPAAPLGKPWDGGPLEIVFTHDAKLYDGRFANNGWLQELPAPMTRLTWDNAALLSPATAVRLGVEDQTLVRLSYGGRELVLPAHWHPGQADGTVSVALGYGRTAAGRVGGHADTAVEPVGADTYRLRTSRAPAFDGGLEIEPTGVRYPLATTQDHFAIDEIGRQGRQARVGKLIRGATLAEYQAHPQFAKHVVHHPPLKSLWEEHRFDGHRWAMTVDLSKCTGCGACVVACQAENNIPVVGKDRVLEGREMHWLRIDRYFTHAPDDPQMQIVVQPIPCQQCELASCEQVCPVGATVHSKEGLNDMVYNRCVGTRYCANNCPYKVRRFNFFNYHKEFDDPASELKKMAYNPEVTVRCRGVMEKCTYCVQRIQAAKIDAKNAGRPLRDGEIRTACQQACPAGAIVFGDLGDPQSEVARLTGADRAYQILAELNGKPRTSYLARIRNANAELESGDGA